MAYYPAFTYNDSEYTNEFNWSNANYTMQYENYFETASGTHYDIFGITIAIVIGVIALVGIVGNLTVMFTIAFTKELRTVRNALVFNLSLASMLILALDLPTTMHLLFSNNWSFGDAWCKLSFYFQEVARYVSVYTLFALAAAVFDLLVYPFLTILTRGVRITNTLSILISTASIWVVCLACLSPLVTFMEKIEVSPLSIAYCSWTGSQKDTRILGICTIVLMYAMPLSIAITLSVCAIAISSHAHTQRPLKMSDHVDTQHDNRHEAVTYLFYAIIVVIFRGPMQLYNVLQIFGNIGFNNVVFYILAILFNIPSSVFPVIIFARSGQLRRCFRNIICCVKSDSRSQNRNGTDAIDLQTTSITNAP